MNEWTGVVVLNVVVALAIALAAPSATWTVHGSADVALGPAHAGVLADNDGAAARTDSPLGWQVVDVRSACVPDLDATCDTVIDCTPGTLNCWATKRPRAPFPCQWNPDGSMVCDIDNGTSPNETAPPPDPMEQPPNLTIPPELGPPLGPVLTDPVNELPRLPAALPPLPAL